jgi:TRAP-type mannitol/chloroaromatic compound transport system substrate-binding protein
VVFIALYCNIKKRNICSIIKGDFMFKNKVIFLTSIALLAASSSAMAVNLKIQSVLNSTGSEVGYVRDFAEDVAALTDGRVTMEVLPGGSVVPNSDLIDAVDAGLIDGGFAWTHYWSGKHPAAMLFGSPIAGAGLGIDNIAWLSWFHSAGGKELYDQLWDEMDLNVVGLMLQPVGPEALGWFKEPINSMDDFRKLRFRAPPGIPGQTYKDIGVAAVAMGGGDILPALEKGVIDAAEWCCPEPDRDFGFQKVLKYYYLQGLHQNVVNADMYINGDRWNEISPRDQRAIHVAARAARLDSMSNRIYANGIAMADLLEQGVQLMDTPDDYFVEFMAAANATLQKNADENAFFAEVWASQRDFAEKAVPFWSGAQSSNAKLGLAFAKTLQ